MRRAKATEKARSPVRRAAAWGAAFCLLLSAGCANRRVDDSTRRFGMDIRQLSPLVMTATDEKTGETAFSRDASVISEVTALFEKMKPVSHAGGTEERGLRFTVSTMYGNFTYGECRGNHLWLNGKDYTLDKDYSEELRRIYERLQSETAHTTDVSRAQILAVRPEMTYRQLLDAFGDSLDTAVTSEERAVLYKYRNRPFYIRYHRDTDTVGMTGEQLLENIWSSYNLSDLAVPTELSGGRLDAYTLAFERVMDKLMSSRDDRPSGIVLDTSRLVHLEDSERVKLAEFLRDKYGVPVEDTARAALLAAGDGDVQTDTAVLWVEEYSYIGDSSMTFSAAGRRGGETQRTATVDMTVTQEQWKG